MPTKWQAWNSVMENYWVEVDAISKSKIRQRIWRRPASLTVTSNACPGLSHSSSFLGSHPRPEKPAGYLPPQTPKTPGKLPSVAQLFLHTQRTFAKPHPIHLRRVKIHLVFFVPIISKGLQFQMEFQMVSTNSFFHRRKSL